MAGAAAQVWRCRKVRTAVPVPPGAMEATLRLCWFPTMKRKHPELPDRYDAFLQELKERIRSAQVRAALSVNRELVLLYWGIGRDILIRQ